MDDNLALQMLNRVEREIIAARSIIDTLTPRAEAYDLILKIVGLLPDKSGCAEQDFLWTVRVEKQKIEETLAAKKD